MYIFFEKEKERKIKLNWNLFNKVPLSSPTTKNMFEVSCSVNSCAKSNILSINLVLVFSFDFEQLVTHCSAPFVEQLLS